MDFTTIINIAQYVLSVLVIPAIWFILKLWNNVSHLNQFRLNTEKAKEKEEQKHEEKEAKREEWERSMYKAIIEMSKDMHYVKEQLKK